MGQAQKRTGTNLKNKRAEGPFYQTEKKKVTGTRKWKGTGTRKVVVQALCFLLQIAPFLNSKTTQKTQEHKNCKGSNSITETQKNHPLPTQPFQFSQLNHQHTKTHPQPPCRPTTVTTVVAAALNHHHAFSLLTTKDHFLLPIQNTTTPFPSIHHSQQLLPSSIISFHTPPSSNLHLQNLFLPPPPN